MASSGNNVASTEATVLFRGVANAPESIRETSLRLSFNNRLNFSRVLLPEVRIQKRCPWLFPSTAEQRAEAIDGGARAGYSPFFRCGYSAGEAGYYEVTLGLNWKPLKWLTVRPEV